MSLSNESATNLRARGFRLTPQRLTILEVLSKSQCHLTPAEIFERGIEAAIPDGVPDNVVRTVTENSRTLKFTSHGFEREKPRMESPAIALVRLG